MSVNRYSVGYKDSASGRYAAMLDKPDGGYVSHEDYAELEQKFAESKREFRAADATIENLQMQVEKLAAENAGLKSIQEWAVADVFKSGAKRFESTKAAGFDADDCLHDAVLVMLSELKTPATDAFLAEVRASAIDSLVDIKTKQLADMHPDTHAFGATAMSIRSQINELQVFAALLRKGVQS